MTAIHGYVPVIDEPGLAALDWAVWAALCTFCEWERAKGKPIKSKAGSCFPSDKAIAKRAHCSVATVKRCVRRLEELGYVSRTERHGDKGEQRSNDYTLYANGGAPRREEDKAEFLEKLAELSRTIRNGDTDVPA